MKSDSFRQFKFIAVFSLIIILSSYSFARQTYFESIIKHINPSSQNSTPFKVALHSKYNSTVIFLWAKWCEPCHKLYYNELSSLAKSEDGGRKFLAIEFIEKGDVGNSIQFDDKIWLRYQVDTKLLADVARSRFVLPTLYVAKYSELQGPYQGTNPIIYRKFLKALSKTISKKD